MKKQNDPAKTKHYRAYRTKKKTMDRYQQALDAVPEHCWWLKTYLRGIYFPQGR